LLLDIADSGFVIQRVEGATPAISGNQRTTGQRMTWFRRGPLRHVIHWGLYAVPAGEWNGKPVDGIGEWIMNNGHIPVADYEKLADRFNPVKFNASAWVLAAESCRHSLHCNHQQASRRFSMFDSRVSDYTIVKSTPFQRDPMKELAAACQGSRSPVLLLSLDHGLASPRCPTDRLSGLQQCAFQSYFPRYMQYYLKPQLKELLTNYGPLESFGLTANGSATGKQTWGRSFMLGAGRCNQI